MTLSWASRAPDEPADLGPEHQARHRIVGLPAIADLAGAIRRIAPLLPVPLIGIESRLEPAAEQVLEARRHRRRRLGLDEAVQNQESILVEIGDLAGGKLDHGG